MVTLSKSKFALITMMSGTMERSSTVGTVVQSPVGRPVVVLKQNKEKNKKLTS